MSFSISDVFLPGQEEILTVFSGAAEVEGRVVDFSDSGSSSRVFAVVEVIQRQTLVVPVEKLRVVAEPGGEPPGQLE